MNQTLDICGCRPRHDDHRRGSQQRDQSCDRRSSSERSRRNKGRTQCDRVIVVVIEDSALIVQMISVVTGVMGFGVPVDENFVVAVNLRLVHVLRRQNGESAHGQG